MVPVNIKLGSQVRKTSSNLSYSRRVTQWWHKPIIWRSHLYVKLHYPIEHGIIRNWEHMEKLWEYGFRSALNLSPNEHDVLITEAAQNPKVNTEKIT
jgi:hypothetical protein